jgi:trehalose/maltose hydrolase-like predicted phosphorylase
MHEALEPTRDPGWLLSHQGYNVLTESAVESSLALGNGFLGMRAARSVSRGPTWVAWLGYSRWASWPRCYVAGLFDMPNTEPPVPALVPVADWSRVRILLDGEPLLAREGEVLLGISGRWRTARLQFLQLALDRNGIDVKLGSPSPRKTGHACGR